MAKPTTASLLRSARRLWRQLLLLPEVDVATFPAAPRTRTSAPAVPAAPVAADNEWTLSRNAANLLLGLPGAGTLPARVRVRWNARLRTTAGQAFPGQALVTLNPRLRDFPGETDRTLRHELAHLLAWQRAASGRRRHAIAPHGPEWQAACVDLGIDGEERCHRLVLGPRRAPPARRHAYGCPHCGFILRRVRPIAPRRPLACLRCCREHAGGRFDRRFQFARVRGGNDGAAVE